MQTSFSTRLALLRKESGISQKQAAAELGLSQALLSHYERGIRECGLDFLRQAAECYGVTVDYLLGTSDSRHGFGESLPLETDLPEDARLSTAGIHRGAMVLEDGLGSLGDAASCSAISRILSLQLYKILLYKAAEGQLPQNWVPQCEKLYNPMYLALLDEISNALLREVPDGSLARRKKIPLCLETLVRETQEYVQEQLEQLTGGNL